MFDCGLLVLGIEVHWDWMALYEVAHAVHAA